MSPAVHHRSPPTRHSHYQSDSPVKRRPRRDRSPELHRSSTREAPSRVARSRSPAKEKSSTSGGSGRSAKRERSRSPRKVDRNEASRSPSPRTKRLGRALAEREPGKVVDKEREKGNTRGHDKERHKERLVDREKGEARSSRAVRRERSESPVEREHRRRQGSGSPSWREKAQARDEGRHGSEAAHPSDGEQDSVAKMKAAEEALDAKQKEKPSFELSGKLAEETNRFRGVTLLFTEPSDARKPDIRWRLYVFKAGEVLNDPLYVHRQSCYLFGRERRVADIPTDHPSCSKQHAVIQYRLVEKEQPDGMMKKQVRPYLMDLGSTNGTFLNDNRLEPQRYYELFEKDTIKFGNSSREYVLLHENSVH